MSKKERIDESKIRSILQGIMDGDGDLGSRMASSYPGARPGYPEPLCTLVETANEVYTNGTFGRFSDKEKQDWIDRSIAAIAEPKKVKVRIPKAVGWVPPRVR